MSDWEVLGLLGRGGFGRVYLVRRTGPDGWTREVAVKLIDPKRADESSLRRLRDEARILAAVHDRAVVSAEPPVHLREGWAVVMEYVPGCTLGALLDRGLRLPDTVALEVVQEVARALSDLSDLTSADGGALGLVHRDLKPANVQLTHTGAVKILDFGIARARLADREASTTRAIVGTPGYIAPERLLGQDGPAGDIYALGALLAAATGASSSSAEPTLADPDEPAPFTPPASPLAPLLRAMTAWSPTDRPSAREVVALARELRLTLVGPGLAEWCHEHVPAWSTLERDDLVGATLSEQSDPAKAAAPWPRLVVVTAAAVAGLTLLVSWPTAEVIAPPEPVTPVAAPSELRAPAPTPGPPAETPAPPAAVSAPAAPAPTASARQITASPTERRPTPAAARPTATTEPAPTPAPTIEPTAAPPPEPTEPNAPAPWVSVAGDAASVRVQRGGRSLSLPAALPAGTWTVEVTFPGHTPFALQRPLVVVEHPVVVSCSLRFNNCSW
jgi:hypothetical protein